MVFLYFNSINRFYLYIKYMKAKNILYLGLIFFFLTLISCEGGTTFTKHIENNTNDTLIVKLYLNYMGSDSINILPNETKEVYWDEIQGLFIGEEYYCASEIDSAHITTKNNKVLIKDILNSDNWLHESKDGRKSREFCLFIINENDLN